MKLVGCLDVIDQAIDNHGGLFRRRPPVTLVPMIEKPKSGFWQQRTACALVRQQLHGISGRLRRYIRFEIEHLVPSCRPPRLRLVLLGGLFELPRQFVRPVVFHLLKSESEQRNAIRR